METKTILDNLLTRFESDDPNTLITALDEGVELANQLSNAAVQRIKHPSVGMFVAERVYEMIAVMIDNLETFLANSTVTEERVNAAVALLHLGSKSGVPDLLAAIDEKGGDPVMAANQLARRGIEEAAEHIVALLRRQTFADPLIIAALLENLKKLHAPLPPDLQSKFTGEAAHPWVRQVALDETPPLPPPPTVTQDGSALGI